MRIRRPEHLARVERLLRENPVVAMLGARQVGKTTLAHEIARRSRRATFVFDLEDPRDRARLDEPTLALEPLRGLVVIDEVQHRPDLFPVLRVLADRPRRPARFLVLGSAAPGLLQQGAESLAGRIAFHELPGFGLDEVGVDSLQRLWLRGGFPRSYLAPSVRGSDDWRRAFLRAFLERDLPQLGATMPPAALERFWTMLAHYHGQVLNASELGRSFGITHPTVQRYLDLLEGAFVVKQLRPWSENVGKRIVKSPKIYVSDSGLLHALLGLASMRDLERHPKLGASWEGFLLDQVVRRLGARSGECYFWAVHAGAELDLLVVRGRRRLGFEFKRTDAPTFSASMHAALELLRLDELVVVHAGARTFRMRPRVRALAAADLLAQVSPLS